jgi:hypothetical protein
MAEFQLGSWSGAVRDLAREQLEIALRGDEERGSTAPILGQLNAGSDCVADDATSQLLRNSEFILRSEKEFEKNCSETLHYYHQIFPRIYARTYYAHPRAALCLSQRQPSLRRSDYLLAFINGSYIVERCGVI